MSARSRRQTRSRRFDVPYGRWPEVHNRGVRLRKRTDELTRKLRDVSRAARRAKDAIANLGTAFTGSRV